MWVRTASLVGIFLCHLVCFAASYAQLAPSNATYTVRGAVVNSVTGEPIQRALVQLEGNPQRHLLTGVDGKFEFQNIPAGVLNVNLQKPGYFPEQALRSRRGQPTFITVGPDRPLALLKLVPEAVISGHVLGDGGEPVEGLPLQVLGEQIQNGRKTWSIISNTQTDDLGEFRCAELQPGRYYVFAGPSPWPASFAPQARIQARAQMRALAGGRPAARGYPGVFYPAANDRNSATLLEVRAGQHVEINFNVASQVFHTISGTVSGYLSNAGLNLQATNAAGTQVNANFNFDAERGTFRTQWLPPGRYILSAETRDNDGHGSYATLDVNLTSDLTGVHLQLLPGPTIPVNFVVEKTRSETPELGLTVERRWRSNALTERRGYEPARVVLTSLDPSAGNGQRQFNSQLGEGENSGIEIPGLPPGIYSVRVYPNGPYYIATAHCGSVNVLEQNLTVAAGAAVQPIEIVLRDDYAQLRGTVRLPPEADFAAVLLIPERSGQQMQDFGVSRPQFGRRDAQAEFSMQFAPGTYHVIAVDRADDFEYADPEVLRKYADKAREVTIVANEKTEVELELVHIED